MWWRKNRTWHHVYASAPSRGDQFGQVIDTLTDLAGEPPPFLPALMKDAENFGASVEGLVMVVYTEQVPPEEVESVRYVGNPPLQLVLAKSFAKEPTREELDAIERSFRDAR